MTVGGRPTQGLMHVEEQQRLESGVRISFRLYQELLVEENTCQASQKEAPSKRPGTDWDPFLSAQFGLAPGTLNADGANYQIPCLPIMAMPMKPQTRVENLKPTKTSQGYEALGLTPTRWMAAIDRISAA